MTEDNVSPQDIKDDIVLNSNITEIVPQFTVDQDFINTYKDDERIIKLIRQMFPSLTQRLITHIFIKLYTNQPIVFNDFVPKGHRFFSVSKKKIDDKFQLLPLYHFILKNNLNALINKITEGFQDLEDDKKEVITFLGKKCYKINKTHSKDELFRWLCEENGDLCFKYDFDIPDLDFNIPCTNNNLQRCQAQITSLPITFGLVVEHKYTCPDRNAQIQEDICDSSHIITKKAWEVEAVKDRIMCPGRKHSITNDGRHVARRCGISLTPIEKKSRFIDAYYYDINFEDENGLMQSSSAFSLNKLMPGFYDSILFSYTGNLKPTNYQIVDVKPIEDVAFNIPTKEENKNFIITLQEEIDNFIQKQTGQRIYGLIPIKLALILQKLASVLDYPLKLNIDFTGEKSTGKSMLLKYYGLFLYNYSHLGTNGLSISVPALRGTTDKVYVMNKEININRIGFLGTYKSIHIDEVGENEELVQHLKIFLMESNYSNNMARADSATRKRIAHVNLSKNLNHEHLGQYRGSLKKIYDNLEQKENIPYVKWDNKWDLFQPLDYYEDNPYLKDCIRKQREKFIQEQKWWIDGADLALHDRFPFYFYVEDDNNQNLKEVLKENATKKKIEEITLLLKKLKNKDLENYFKSLKEFDKDVDKDVFNEVENIIKNYHLIVDSRISDIYYMIIRLSMIINKREKPSKEDFDLLCYFLETTNRKVTTSEIEKYKVKGASQQTQLPQHLSNNIEQKNIEFKIITNESDVLEDFK